MGRVGHGRPEPGSPACSDLPSPRARRRLGVSPRPRPQRLPRPSSLARAPGPRRPGPRRRRPRRGRRVRCPGRPPLAGGPGPLFPRHAAPSAAANRLGPNRGGSCWGVRGGYKFLGCKGPRGTLGGRTPTRSLRGRTGYSALPGTTSRLGAGVVGRPGGLIWGRGFNPGFEVGETVGNVRTPDRRGIRSRLSVETFR